MTCPTTEDSRFGKTTPQEEAGAGRAGRRGGGLAAVREAQLSKRSLSPSSGCTLPPLPQSTRSFWPREDLAQTVRLFLLHPALASVHHPPGILHTPAQALSPQGHGPAYEAGLGPRYTPMKLPAASWLTSNMPEAEPRSSSSSPALGHIICSQKPFAE